MNCRSKCGPMYHDYQLSVVSKLTSNKRLQLIMLKKRSPTIFLFNRAEPRMHIPIKLSGKGEIFERGEMTKNLMIATLIIHISVFKYLLFWLVSVHSKSRLSLFLLRAVQSSFKKRKKFYYLLRWSHFLKLHILVWMCGPVQALLVTSHDLPRIWVPEPQVTEHFVQSDHGDQPSSLSSAAEQKVQKST